LPSVATTSPAGGRFNTSVKPFTFEPQLDLADLKDVVGQPHECDVAAAFPLDCVARDGGRRSWTGGSSHTPCRTYLRAAVHRSSSTSSAETLTVRVCSSTAVLIPRDFPCDRLIAIAIGSEGHRLSPSRLDAPARAEYPR
jgi:hypothetical protein